MTKSIGPVTGGGEAVRRDLTSSAGGPGLELSTRASTPGAAASHQGQDHTATVDRADLGTFDGRADLPRQNDDVGKGGLMTAQRVAVEPCVVSSPPQAPPTRAHRPGAHVRPNRAWSRGRLPLGVLGIILGCLLAWRAALHSGLFDDVFWHLAAGQWMLSHHAVLRRDVFSYTVRGHSWTTPEWGYDVVLAEAVHLVGPVAFWLLSAGLASLTVLAVAVRSRILGAGWTWTGLLSLEVGAAVTLLLDDRPQMVSYLLLALLLLILTLARRKTAWLWSLPVIFVIWANMHGSFLLGLAVVALDVILAIVPVRLGRLSAGNPLKPIPALASFGGAVLATLFNPFGIGVYASALGVTFNSSISQIIEEWQSPNFHNSSILLVFIIPVGLMLAYLTFSRRDVPTFDFVLTVFLLICTLDAVRFLPYFVVCSCGLAAVCRPSSAEQWRPTLLTWPLLVLITISMLAGAWYPAGRAASSEPVRATDFLEQHPGRVFSTYLWNDYLISRRIPVFVDGRTELYTDTPIFREYLAVDQLTVSPDSLLRSYGVEYVLWPSNSPLSIYLTNDRRWRPVWRSRSTEVFHYVGG